MLNMLIHTWYISPQHMPLSQVYHMTTILGFPQILKKNVTRISWTYYCYPYNYDVNKMMCFDAQQHSSLNDSSIKDTTYILTSSEYLIYKRIRTYFNLFLKNCSL